MADLPMAQIPNFQLSAPNPQLGIGTALQGGQQLNQALQFQAQQKQALMQMQIEKNLKMMELGTNIVLEGGDDALPTGQQLIRQAYPFLTGQQLPPDLPIDKSMAKGMDYWTSRYRAFQKDPTDPNGSTAADAVFGIQQEIAHKSLKQQQAQEALLKDTQMYKAAMANQVGGTVNGQPAMQNEFTGQVTGAGGQAIPGGQSNFITAQQGANINAENQRNALNQNNETMRTLGSDFNNKSEEAKNVFDQFGVFDAQMNTAQQFQNAKNTTAAAAAQQAAITAMAQMQFPGTGRPGSPEFMDRLQTLGSGAQKLEQMWDQVKKGNLLTPDQVLGLKQSGFNIVKAREQSQTDDENSTGAAIAMHGGDPRGFIQNRRPSYLNSTSKLFPSQGNGQPLVGSVIHAKLNGKEGDYQLIGTNRDPASGNWVPVNGQQPASS